jgi:hypothetical protein
LRPSVVSTARLFASTPPPPLYNLPVRPLLLALLALSAQIAEPPATPADPLRDGSESIEQYAKKANLEPTKTLDLANGVKLEMVLIARLAGRAILLNMALHDKAWCAWLAQWGFAEQRPFIRMVRGPNDFPASPARCFAIGGPAFG